MAILIHFGADHSQERWRNTLQRLDPSLEFRLWPDEGNAEDIDAIVVWKHIHGELLGYPNLKLICNLGAGVQHILGDDNLPEGIPFTRVVDPRMTSAMAEYVLLHVLRYHRHFDETQTNQKDRKWEYLPPDNAATTTIGFLGLGELGRHAANLVRALGFDVAGWSRSAKKLDGITTYHGEDGLVPFLNSTKMLVCLLPLTSETEGIINARTLSALPEGAYLINAARGGHVIDADLIAALDYGTLEGATLDVFHEEPLPDDHPFWTHPRITVTPHNAADSFPDDVAPQIVDNIHRALEGRELLNPVDVGRGY